MLTSCEMPANFANLFDYCSNFFVKRLNASDSLLYFDPLEMDGLVVGLLSASAASNILQLHAGTAHLTSALAPSVRFSGVESYTSFVVTGRLRLMAHQRDRAMLYLSNPAHFRDGESTEAWAAQLKELPTPGAFDYIISLLPINSRLSDAHLSDMPVIEVVLDMLKRQGAGKALVACTHEFLTNSSSDELALRKRLVDSGLLDTVIRLPGDIWPAFKEGFSLLMLDASKPRAGRVRLIDATSLYLTDHPHRRELDTAAILAAINGTHTDYVTCEASFREVRDTSYILLPARYVGLSVTSEFDVPLKDVLHSAWPRSGLPLEEQVAIVSSRDLRSDTLDFRLKATDLRLAQASRPLRGPLRESVLLVSNKGRTLRPTLFLPHAGEVWLQESVTPWEVKTEKVDLLHFPYLIAELNSDYVARQVEALQIGSALSRLSEEDFLSLRIRLLSLEEQRGWVEDFREARIVAKRDELRLLEQGHQTKRQAFELLADLKHALGRPLGSLVSAVDIVRAVVQKLGITDYPVGDPALGDTVGKTVESMTADLETIATILSRSEAELRPEEYACKRLNIGNYLDELVARTRLRERYFDLRWTNGLVNSVPLVFANKHLLDLLFGHIFDNAARHGFRHVPLTEDPGHMVEVDAQIVRSGPIPRGLTHTDFQMQTSVEIYVSNNGLPLPENFDLAKLTRKHAKAGPSANTGIGGYEVQQIVSALGGTLDVVRDFNEQWAVCYIIRLPVEAQEFLSEIAEQEGE